MKKTVIPVLVFLLMGATLFAQDSKVTTGVVAFQGQDFKKAIDAFNVALQNPSDLKEKNVPKAYYYRALSQLQYMGQLASGENAEANQATIKAMVFKIYDDLKKAKESDSYDKWGKKVDQQLPNVNFALLQGGLRALNEAEGKGMTEADRNAKYKEVIRYMDNSEEIDGTNYMTNDVRAQSLLAMGDSTGAYTNFAQAAKKFEATPPKRPDQLVAYIYYRMALLERYKMNDIDKALANLEKGKEMLDKEHARLMEKKDSYPPEAIQASQKQYTQAKEYLTKFELDLLLNSPDKLEQALGKFDAAIAKEPKNYILHVAYAQLLEKVDEEKAAEIYEKATAIDPKKEIAFFNLGAMFVNQGVALYKQANEISDDYDKAKALQEKGDALYKKAFPYLQKAQEIKPCDPATLQAIMNICINLSSSDESMMTEYKKYKDIKANCK